MNLVSTLGTTPGGVAETYLSLVKGNYLAPFPNYPLKIDEIVVVRTKGTDLSFSVLSTIFSKCVSSIPIREVKLSIDDVMNPQDFKEVRERVRSLLSPGNYLDFTGGRKAISAAAALAAREAGAHLVSTTVDQDTYARMNEAMRRIAKGEDVDPCNLLGNGRTIVFF